MDVALTALPFLLFLACPLMMVFCILGMRKAGCSTSSADAEDASAQPRGARVAALEGQLALIQTELRALRTEGATRAADSSPGEDRPGAHHTPEVDHAARQPA